MAKRHWLAQGDKNSKFYHVCVNQKRKKNCIKRVEDDATNLLKAMRRFQGVFSSIFLRFINLLVPQYVPLIAVF